MKRHSGKGGKATRWNCTEKLPLPRPEIKRHHPAAGGRGGRFKQSREEEGLEGQAAYRGVSLRGAIDVEIIAGTRKEPGDKEL